jgi:hypothetical protein
MNLSGCANGLRLDLATPHVLEGFSLPPMPGYSLVLTGDHSTLREITLGAAGSPQSGTRLWVMGDDNLFEDLLVQGGNVGVQLLGDGNTLRRSIIRDAHTCMDVTDGETSLASSTLVGCTFGVVTQALGSTAIDSVILWSDGPDLAGSGPSTVMYSDVRQGAPPGAGNISINPKLVDVSAGNFELADGSPCIDAGNPALQVPVGGGDQIDMGRWERTWSEPQSACEAASEPGHLASAQLFIDKVTDVDHAFDTPEANAWGSPGSINWVSFTGVTMSPSFFTISLLRSDSTITPTLVQSWWGSKSPSSAGYYDQIVQQHHFLRVLNMDDLLPGDVLAIKYLDSANPANSGHVAMLEGCPGPLALPIAPVVADTTQYAMNVVDSTSSAHGCTINTPASDTRWVPNNPAAPCASGGTDMGAGRGVVRFYARSAGLAGAGEIMGYAWSLASGSPYYPVTGVRPSVIGRFVR